MHNIYDAEDTFTFVAQTTFSVKAFTEMVDFLSEYKNIKVENTICHSTENRQQQVRELAQNVDMFIVVGGKGSSNTKKLFEIASEYCEAYHIESVKELPKNIKHKKIGYFFADREHVFCMSEHMEDGVVLSYSVDDIEGKYFVRPPKTEWELQQEKRIERGEDDNLPF